MENNVGSSKITQSDIAKRLGLSRNTISKAINGEAGVSEKLRQTILETAAEMGYKKLTNAEEETARSYQNITLINSYNAFINPYWNPVVAGIEEVLRSNGYNLNVSILKDNDQDKLIIPETVNSSQTDGIVITGVIKKEYIEKILKTGIPIVFVDTFFDITVRNLMADTIMMDNHSAIYEITTHLIKKGHKDIGFIGDIYTCRSFYERWLGYKTAMEDAGLQINYDFCVTGDNMSERNVLKEKRTQRIKEMEKLPTAFVCTNDRRAIEAIILLKERGIRVPEDIAFAGFDNIAEATILSPALTTVHCFNEELGRRTASELLWRIGNPNSPFEMVTLPTKVVYRESTNKTVI